MTRQGSIMPLRKLHGLCLLLLFWLHGASACQGALCMGTNDFSTAPWVVVFICSPAAVASLFLLVFGILDFRDAISSSACSRAFLFTANCLAALFWLLLLPLTAYLVAQQQLAIIAFLVFGTLALLAHAAVIALYVRRGMHRLGLQEQPRQQLLTSREKPPATAGVDVEAPHNPFGAPTLGIIPGTSNTGYMLWLPTESELPWSPEGPQQQQQRPWSPAEGQPQPPQQHSHLHFYPQPPQQHGRALRGGGKAKADSSAAVDQLQEGGEAAASAQQPSPPRGKDDKGKAPLFPSHHPASS